MTRSKKQKLQSLESVAETARANLTQASRLLSENELGLASVLSRSTWPVIVWVVQQRLTNAKRPHARQRPTTATIKGWSSNEGLNIALQEQMRVADVAAVMGPDTPSDTLAIVEAGLAALNATDTPKVRRRRELAAQEPRRRFGVRRWASAAVALLTFGLVSGSA